MPLPALAFDNRFVRELPADPVAGGGVRQVRGAAYSRVAPTPVAAPRLLAYSRELAATLGLDEPALRSDDFLAAFSGNRPLPGMDPWAANYGGHQFGSWAGQLGDGRAIGLGEVIGPDGARWELQLKGAGPTPYSRFADGRAVLRSSLREFLCSEAMFHLGVPTTRALSLVATGEPVLRDMFYDGNARAEPGAIVCRAAPSFVRFGTFELPASRGETSLLQALVDFTLARDFPHLTGAQARADWFIEVCERTALLVAHWMRVGFVHGVLNTDNMSILGLTLDYGPYGWLEAFDADWTPNTTDAEGRRYSFGRQPEIAHWNLARLAGAIAPLFDDQAPLQQGLRRYAEAFGAHHGRMMADKLGLETWRGDADQDLARQLFTLLETVEVDYPIFCRELAAVDPAAPSLAPLEAAFYDPSRREARAATLLDWLSRWGARVLDGGLPDAERRRRMDAANPRIVPRNWLAQEAIDAAEQGDVAVLEALLEACRTPYTTRPGDERYAARRPEWARHRAGCSMLSCSS